MDGEFWFGVNIRYDSRGFKWLKTQIATRKSGASLGWFGYAHHYGENPRLEIWIYTGAKNAEKAKEVADLIERQVGGIDKPVVDKYDNEFNVIVPCGQPGCGDMEWFQDVITKLKEIP